ncbi:alpha/beta fold hydrolase [Phenylobacterium sp.]|uniref:alpha/beta hydrolase n=1 Tax=Phenylobacterium sp. TaxID=1871053 RepID=UPI0025EEE7F7|nr:alpha/beta fold hydrolase [Phenylobacterium sp.]
MNDLSFGVSRPARKGVLLLHGLTGAPGEMRLVARRLGRAGFTTKSPLLAGHGSDERTLLRSTWRDWLTSARAAYLELAADMDEVYVAGICVGGALGLALCAEFPEIKGAAVYSMTFEYDGWNMPRWAMAAPLIQLVANLPLVRRISFEEPYPYGLKDLRLREMASRASDTLIPGSVDRMPLGSLYQMYRLGRHVERIAHGITTPTLIVHADEDDMSDPRNATRLQAALGGASEILRLDDSYHMVHVDKQHALVAQRTASFFGAPLRARVTAEDPVDA